MRELELYQHAIEKKIEGLTFPAEPKNLYDPIRYFLQLGGKRMRPVLVMMAHELFGGKHTDVTGPAVAMELFHNFSLVHDDIMDNAPLRRGKSTVHEKWNTNTAILSGDAILIEAYRLLMECEAKHLRRVLEVFNQTALEVCEGQVMDMDFEKRDNVSIAEYIEMIRLKTAVLLGGSLETGAVLANASEADAKHLYAFGIHLGIAFQLQDDILDVYGDPEKFGKTVGGDIAANKKTFLLLKTRELSDEKDQRYLDSLLSENPNDKIEQVMRLYEKYAIRKEAEKEMQREYELALQHLTAINAPEKNKIPLYQLAAMLMNREN